MDSALPRQAAPCWVLLAALLGAALPGCSSRTSVSLTSSTPALYTHVYLTTQEVWFNTSASAGPDESGWSRFTLTSPVTVDLVSDANGTLTQLIGALKLNPGTYQQLRLIPLDSSAPLTRSASTLGARYNAEVDYIDSSGSAQVLPLEIPNPDQGISIRATLKVPASSVGALGLGTMSAGTSSGALVANGTTFGSATGTFGGTTGTFGGTTGTFGGTTGSFGGTTGAFGGTTGTFGNTNGTFGSNTGDTSTNAGLIVSTGTTGTTGTTRSSGTTNTTPSLVQFATALDGSADLALFTYGAAPAALLSAAPRVVDLSTAGGIQGTLDLSHLTGITAASNRLEIYVSAEALSSDGSRHEVIASSPVQSGGSFLLYPLPGERSKAQSYDVVIHGPAIATLIVRNIKVTSTGTDTSKAISLGTLTPTAATAGEVELDQGTAHLPAGARVSFMQTLPGSSEVPYVIEQAAIDPFTQHLGRPLRLSAGQLGTATFTTTGTTLATTATTPVEGSGTYLVAASAPGYGTGTGARVSIGSIQATVAVPVPALASGAARDTLTLNVAQSGQAYDRGQLLLTHDGALVSATSLDTALAQKGSTRITVDGLPGGSHGSPYADGLYYLSVRAWNSSDPAGTLHRQSWPAALDLRSGSLTGPAITID